MITTWYGRRSTRARGLSPSGGRRGLALHRCRALPALRAEKPRCQADPSGVAVRPFSVAASKAPELLPVAASVFHPRPPLATPFVKPDWLFAVGLAGDRSGKAQGRPPLPNPIAVLDLIPPRVPGSPAKVRPPLAWAAPSPRRHSRAESRTGPADPGQRSKPAV